MRQRKPIKLRFLAMLRKFNPMSRTDLTRKALAYIKTDIDDTKYTMEKLKKLMAKLKREKMIIITRSNSASSYGPKTVDYVCITEKAIKWLGEQE